MVKKIFISIIVMLALVSAADARRVNVPLKKTSDTNKEFVRWASGTSYDMNMARTIAENECRGQLALAVETKVKSAVKTYAMNVHANDRRKMKMDDEGVTETMVTSLAKIILRRVEIEDFKIVKKRGQYIYYVSMSYPKDPHAITNDLVESNIDETTKASILYDREKFEKSLANEFANY